MKSMAPSTPEQRTRGGKNNVTRWDLRHTMAMFRHYRHLVMFEGNVVFASLEMQRLRGLLQEDD